MLVKIRKIANLSEEEISTLTATGKIVGELNKAFENEEITEVSEENTKLLLALSEVISKVLEKQSLVK